jgi:2-haloacid dehalogenase
VTTGVAAKALFFDVFGTCVDWRTSVAREVEAVAKHAGAVLDGTAIADAWRARYQPQMETVRSGRRPWVNLDVLHREALDEVLVGTAIANIDDDARDDLTRSWHRLDPWPDTVPGLTRMKQRYIVAPNSNGHIALILNMARRAGLPWDVILGAETARAYKPLPAAYLRNVAAIGLEPHEVMMVAAHNSDLVAAAACGLQTAFVHRATEHGPGQTTDLEPEVEYDLVAHDFVDLAERLDLTST